MANMIFGKFFWVWIVTFLMSASYLSARSVINLSQLWRPAEKIFAKGGNSHSANALRKKRHNVVTGGHNIFDPNGGLVTPPTKPAPRVTEKPKQREEPKKAQEGGCPPRDPDKEMKESRIRAKLKGTSYVDADPSMSMAAVIVRVKVKKKMTRMRKGKKQVYYRRRTERRVEMFRPGDKMMGAKVCAVERKRIIIYKSGKFETLTIFKKKKNKRKNLFYGAFGQQGPEGTKGPGEVKIRAGDKFVISRKTVNNWLANPMQYAMSARIMPQRGLDGGIRMIWIRKGSLYSQLGLKNGDVVKMVNGKKLSASSALGLYSKLPYAKSLRVSIVRKGVKRTLLYNIK